LVFVSNQKSEKYLKKIELSHILELAAWFRQRTLFGNIAEKNKEKANPREIGLAKEVVPSIAMQIFSFLFLSSLIITKLPGN